MNVFGHFLKVLITLGGNGDFSAAFHRQERLSESERLNEGAMYRIYEDKKLPEIDAFLDFSL